jgi:ribosome-binding protein aMBF1 (putative translation factor)
LQRKYIVNINLVILFKILIIIVQHYSKTVNQMPKINMAKSSPTFAGDPVLVALGAAVRSTRAEMGLSQEALAVDADMDRSYVGGIGRGEHNVTVMNLVKIAEALQVKPSELMETAGI